METILKYAGNTKRYEAYLKGKGDFFFVQATEDNGIETQTAVWAEVRTKHPSITEKMILAFEEIYNVFIHNIAPSTYGTRLRLVSTPPPLSAGTTAICDLAEFMERTKMKIYPTKVDYRTIGVDTHDKWGNDIQEKYPSLIHLFENPQGHSLYKIVNGFVYKSPMISLAEFVYDPQVPYVHPHPFVPVCCLETFQQPGSDTEVLHKRVVSLENIISNPETKLQNELTQLTMDYNTLDHELTRQTTLLQQLQASLNELQTERPLVQTIQNDLSELQTDLRSIVEQYQKHTEKGILFQTLQAQLNALCTKHDEHELLLDELFELRSCRDTHYADLSSKLDSLEEDMNELTTLKEKGMTLWGNIHWTFVVVVYVAILMQWSGFNKCNS